MGGPTTILGYPIHVSPVLPMEPSPGEVARRTVRHGLLNDPSRPACGCDHCTKYPSAWFGGGLVGIVAQAKASYRQRTPRAATTSEPEHVVTWITDDSQRIPREAS